MPLIIIKTLVCGLPQSAMVFSYPGGVMTKLFLTCEEKLALEKQSALQTAHIISTLKD